MDTNVLGHKKTHLGQAKLSSIGRLPISFSTSHILEFSDENVPTERAENLPFPVCEGCI